MASEKQLKEQYLKERGIRKAGGWAINTETMNPEGYAKIFYESYNDDDHLEDVISDFVREVEEYWILEASEEQIFEDINDAIDYAEEGSDVTFERYKEIHKDDECVIEMDLMQKSEMIESKSEMLIKEKWHVERNNGIRQIVASKSMELIVHGLSKTMAFHIVDLHNKALEENLE